MTDGTENPTTENDETQNPTTDNYGIPRTPDFFKEFGYGTPKNPDSGMVKKVVNEAFKVVDLKIAEALEEFNKFYNKDQAAAKVVIHEWIDDHIIDLQKETHQNLNAAVEDARRQYTADQQMRDDQHRVGELWEKMVELSSEVLHLAKEVDRLKAPVVSTVAEAISPEPDFDWATEATPESFTVTRGSETTPAAEWNQTVHDATVRSEMLESLIEKANGYEFDTLVSVGDVVRVLRREFGA